MKTIVNTRLACVLAVGCLLLMGCRDELTVGSKQFTESVILGEVLDQSAESTGQECRHRQDLGGTEVLWQALLTGEIDAYPEYTGTIIEQILDGADVDSFEELEAEMAIFDVRVSKPLGFNNSYALGIRRERARELNLRTISDLRHHPELKFGLSFELLERHDGWPGLKSKYRLPHEAVRGTDHALAYQAMEQGAIDVMDLYSTDAEIAAYDLIILEDDLSYFPKYEAVILTRQDAYERFPAVTSVWDQLPGSIDDQTMTRMNASSRIQKQTEKAVAREFLTSSFEMPLADGGEEQSEFARRFSRLLVNTKEHMILVGISLLAAIVVAVPLGVLAFRLPKMEWFIVNFVGIIQTMPSLALLVFMIPLFGLGAVPAIVALFLYSLLPIVRNTLTGLQQIDPALKESAEVLGLTPWQRLRLIELPIASPSILAGVKTAAVINVGTATLGALINAGGYGQPIITGLRLDDTSLLLQGAIPAAVLAVVVQWGFGWLERYIVPAGIQASSQSS